MLSIARSLAVVLSQNKMIYEFGPDGDIFNAIGGGQIARHRQPGLDAGWSLTRASSASCST